MNILVVEDEHRVADFIVRGLRGEGWTAEHIDTGEKALDVLKQHQFDIVLLDLDMPLKNGYEAAMEITQKKGGKAPMLVAFSGMEENIDDLKGYGFHDMVEKPLDQKKLRYLINQLEAFIQERLK